MKITIVDGETAAHGGLDWGPVRALGEVTEYPLTIASEIVARVKDAQAVLTNKVPFSRAVLDQLPNLKYIGVTATGYNIIDISAARERAIAVTNVPSYSTAAVAQHVFAFILSSCSPITEYNRLSQTGAWSKSPQFCLLDFPIRELRGKTLGIIGYGEIGRQVAEIARAFGMRVIIAALPGRESPGKIALTEMLPEADFVTLHCPLTEQTKELVNADFLRKMKREAALINTARGGLVNELDLRSALSNGTIAHAFLDVLSVEPPAPDHPLIGLANATISPHIAWGTKEARQRLITECAENLAAYKKGEKRNRVD